MIAAVGHEHGVDKAEHSVFRAFKSANHAHVSLSWQLYVRRFVRCFEAALGVIGLSHITKLVLDPIFVVITLYS